MEEGAEEDGLDVGEVGEDWGDHMKVEITGGEWGRATVAGFSGQWGGRGWQRERGKPGTYETEVRE